jgi:hypothetical protein
MQILELPQETNFCSRVICIECKLDDEPCIIYKPLLSVMGVCLAIHYGFGPCFSCSSGTVQQSCKGSIRFILGSVPCLPFPNLCCCQNVSPHSCYLVTCLLFQVCSWWASCSHALWSSSFQCGIWLRWKFNCAICCLLKDRKYLLIHTTGGSWVSLSTTPNNFRTLTFFFLPGRNLSSNHTMAGLSISGVHRCVGRQLPLSSIRNPVAFLPINQLVWHPVLLEGRENKQGTRSIFLAKVDLLENIFKETSPYKIPLNV